jgi:hypothetical protein
MLIFKERNMVKILKYLILLSGITLIIIFLIRLDFSEYKSEDQLLESKIDLKITEKSLHRGFIKLNKDILLSQNCPEIGKSSLGKRGDIGMMHPPYQLKKKANDSIFLVIKDNDSFFFSMIDYSKDKLKDPTFGQLIKRFFNE